MPRRINLKGRVLAVIAILAALVGGGFGAASFASASSSATTLCAKNGTRQVFDFSPCPAGYFAFTVGSGVGLIAPTPAPTVTVTATPVAIVAPVLAAGEAPAVLVQDYGVVLTSTTVPLKWSGATPPTGKTIIGYNIQKKQANAVQWDSTLVKASLNATDYVVTQLKANTAYDFEVQAVYNDTTTGPWSAALPITTPVS